MTSEASVLFYQWDELRAVISANSLESLTMNGREIMERVCKLVCGVLLLADAARDYEPAALEIARRWIQPTTLISGMSVKEELSISQKIVFGDRATWLGVE